MPQLAQGQERPAFRLLGVGTGDQRLFYAGLGRETNSVRLRSSYITGPYRYDGSGSLLLSKRDEAGMLTPVAAIAVPSTMRRPLVFMLPLPMMSEGEVILPYSTLVIEDDTADGSKDVLHYINLSGAQIAVKLGQSAPLAVGPGQSQVVPYAPRAVDDVIETLAVVWRIDAEHDWQPLFDDGSMTVILEGGKRIRVVFYRKDDGLGAQIVNDFSSTAVGNGLPEGQ